MSVFIMLKLDTKRTRAVLPVGFSVCPADNNDDNFSENGKERRLTCLKKNVLADLNMWPGYELTN